MNQTSGFPQNSLDTPNESEPLVNPLARELRIVGLLAKILFLTSLGSLLFAHPIISAGLGFLTFCFWITGVIHQRRVAEIEYQLIDLEQGNHLACWTYTPAEEEAYAEGELDDATDDAAWFFFYFAIGGVVLGLTVSLVTASGVGFLALTIPMLLLGGVVRMGLSVAAEKRNRRIRRGIGKAYIGKNGVYFLDRYLSWDSDLPELVGIERKCTTVPVIEFTFVTARGSRGDNVELVRVPIPEGRSDEARAIVARLTPSQYERP